jgi:DNA-binding NarL/FixJ family response regulator
MNASESAQQSEPNIDSRNNESKRMLEQDIDPLNIKERYQSIFSLYQEGMSIEEIARKAGKGKGEIALILELFGEKKN